MNPSILRRLAEVIAPKVDGVDPKTRLDAAVAIAVEGSDLPPDLANALDEFLGAADDVALRRVQRAVAQSEVWAIGITSFVDLVARLTVEGDLGTEEAAHILSRLPHTERRHLSHAGQHVLDVADAVVEDEKDRVMRIGDDQIFRRALESLVATIPKANIK